MDSTDATNGERRRLTKGQRRKQLLARASAIFSEGGYHNVSMDDIADRAGISKALLYQHFDSKDDLYLAVLRRHQAQLREVIGASSDAGTSPAERLWLTFYAFFEFVEKNQASWGVLYRDAVAIEGKVTRGVHAMRIEIAERIAVLMEASFRERDPGRPALERVPPLAHALVGTVEALADYWMDHPEETKRSLATAAMNLAWVGFGGLLEGEAWRPPHDEINGLE